MESKYMTLEKYAATLKVGDEVTIEYHSIVKGRYINSSVSNKKVNSAAIVECKGFKVRERQI